MTTRSWGDVEAALDDRRHPEMQACGRLLASVRSWEERVLPRVSGFDLMFTLLDDEYPFRRSVRVMWRGDQFEFWLLDTDHVVDDSAVIRQEHSDASSAPATLQSFLDELVAG